jgi:2-isopropylmalate synthase
MPKKITVYDTTLRDGSQGEDVSFSVNDKLRILQKLDDLGIHYIEGGWPGANPKDTLFFKEAKKINLKNSVLTAFGSTRRKKITPAKDPQVKALLNSGVKTVTIVGKSWDFHVKEVLKATLSENLDMITDTIDYLKQKKLEVVFDAEHFFDAWKNDQTYSEEVVLAAVNAGADCICLCDTNGGSMPVNIFNVVAAVKEMIDVPLGIHCHNDCELAVANTIAGVGAGASQVQGTINGLGERAGNANLCSIIPNLVLKMGHTSIKKKNLKKLREVSHLIYELALIAPPTHQPFVGESAFAHKGGQHSDAVRKSPETYEHISPETVGNRRRFIISDLSGTSTITAKAEEYGHTLSKKSDTTKILLDQVKLLEEQGYQFDGAEASFELMMQDVLNKRRQYFDFKGFRVFDIKRPEDEIAMAEATVMVEAVLKGSRVETHTAASGVGPVNALDNALRKALNVYYPRLNEMRLVDFKVRVLPAGRATASKVRVLIESTDGKDTWGTVGVSENIIEASWQALIDSINYKLYKDEKNNKKRSKNK